MAASDETRIDPDLALPDGPHVVTDSAPVLAEILGNPANDPPNADTHWRSELTAIHGVQLEVEPRRSTVRPGELLPGTRFRTLRWLGDGGMGTVFEGVHEDLEREVALKVLRRVGDARHLRMFREEAKTLAKLRSQYAVEVYDFVELADGRVVIAMELLRGETLRDASRSEVMRPERLIPILRQVCKGLADAHAEGIVHRDIKPENITLEEHDGRLDAVKLLDFGIAQVAGRTSGKASRAGTPGYLAPEVVSGLPSDHRSDLYAVGCMAYELATGRRPFVHEDPSIVLLAQIGEVPKPPSVHANVPHALERVIMRCLEKSPDDRYRDAGHLEAALCKAQIQLKVRTAWDDLPLPDISEERLERLRRGMPRPEEARSSAPLAKWLIVAAVVLVVLVVAVVLNSTSSGVEADPQFQRVEQLAVDARAAAAKAFFVYPPPEDARTPTAFSKVRDLEAQEGAAEALGRERAAALRVEFADTLERLGDKYWESEDGKAFALDYYAEALVFDPERAEVLRRASMTPGELRLLRRKAEAADFSPDELVVMEPLIALAEQDQTARVERIERIASSGSSQSRRRRRQLRSLLPDAAAAAAPEAKQASAATPAGTDKVAEGVESPSRSPDDVDNVEPQVIVVQTADPLPSPTESLQSARAEARRFVEVGRKAHAEGRSGAAEKAFAAALTEDRRYSPAYAGLGRVAYDRGSYARAARMLHKAVRLTPKNAQLRIELGDAYFKSFDYSAARAQYQRAKQLGATAADRRLAKVAGKGFAPKSGIVGTSH